MSIAVRSTAIATFPSRVEAEQAVRSLLQAGFPVEQLGIVLPASAMPSLGAPDEVPTAIWAGEIFRSLVSNDIPEEEIRYYEEALEECRALVMVRPGDRYPDAMQILHQFGGDYLSEF